jgi:type IV secretory pathway component VirB8
LTLTAFHRVTLMSTPDEQTRYKAMHDAPVAPARALRDRGYVQIDNFQFWPVGDGTAKTHEYVVKFDRREMHAGQPVPLKGEPYTAQIAFQFHPEYPMATPDRRLNVTGLQVLSYRIHADNPTARN